MELTKRILVPMRLNLPDAVESEPKVLIDVRNALKQKPLTPRASRPLGGKEPALLGIHDVVWKARKLGMYAVNALSPVPPPFSSLARA